jgi:hypothetical protein
MKKILFFFAMLAGVAASAQSDVTVNPVSANYANKTVTFTVSWLNSSRTGTHNSNVWVFVDCRTVTGNASSGSWTRALISGTPTATFGVPSRETGNDKGFWLQGTSGSSGTYNATVTVALSNVPAQFNWCAYVTDYPPNATIIAAGYQLKGTPPFDITYDNGSATSTSAKTFTLGCINTITDATGCPGLIEALAAPASSSNGSRCNTGTVTISATPPAGSTIDWYTTSSGTTLVANGSGTTTLITPSISVTTNYYAASRHLVTGCVSSTRRTVTATVTNSSGRDVAVTSCGCTSGLTSVGGYCRDLAADGASSYTGCGVEVKAANTGSTFCWSAIGSACPQGWRLPTLEELRCLYANQSYTTNWDMTGTIAYGTSTTGACGRYWIKFDTGEEICSGKGPNECDWFTHARCVR